ncbi:TetR/AcrR family transcriptional regulator [Burkholderia pseudomultivorans]|uniref:HTH-type transcriptional regulator MtrR n=1 Tax=Burkholderia pseudomultivorans TaxID=1207504 RepID=A0A132EF67_9BURK|nr:TetR/AcrR family transcriptional regulator [Burkholderia pseudomultivorans]KWF26638.1 TetR family transcriptional regulator [Burkholderia pseudomultivorans]MDR8731042.1 HTH-type transcriptional regulator MtrR [Burkholderia pseudomultivorans]MDR8738600.1 HTH-type transcriptional regulator MtrR [Burkholderia pseudomultivorans]MDR8745013.1 HTH-type transcriptional regulator MtrR [Burkholderia pseudomultivorans]MDR8757992.1 HTH-type transcriptional regulator MtrR [Burkholderia pseudomultivorans
MKPKRLTREQSKDQTRERLLNAAQSIFLKKGFVAASVEDIAAAAGYTRGAFYSNFRSKAELLLELLERDHVSVQDDLKQIFEGGGTREQMEATALAYYRRMHVDDRCFLLWVEAKLQAARDAKFRVQFNQFLLETRARMAEIIRAFAERSGTPLRLPAETLALGLMSLCDGVQAYYTADPQQVSAEAAEAVLAGFFSWVVLGRAPD